MGNQVSATTIMLGNLMADVAKQGASVVKQVASVGIDYNRQMETYATNFTTMLGGSASAAEKLTADLEDMAAATPFAMTDLADATQILLQFGQDSDSVLGTLQSLGDIAMGDANKLSSLTLAFAQASSSGKLMGQDLMQMINAGFNPLQTIVEKTGASMADLKDFMSSGKASDVLKKQMQKATEEVARMGDEASDGAKMLVQMAEDGAISAELLGQIFNIETSPGGKFYKAMENASKTYEGMVSTLEDDTSALMGKVMEPAFDFMTDTLLPKAIAVVGELDEAYDLGGLTGMASKATDILNETLGTWGTAAFDAGSGMMAQVLSGLTGDTVNKEEIKNFFTTLGNDGAGALNVIVDAGGGLLKGIWDGLTNDTENKTNIVQEISSLWNSGKTSLTQLVGAGGNLFGTIYTSLTKRKASANNVGEFIGEVFNGAGIVITGLKDTAVDTLEWISTNSETVSAAVGPMLAMFAGLKIKSNPLIGVVSAISILTTDWEEFEKTNPQLVSTFETLSGLEFDDFKSGVEGIKGALNDLVTWYNQNKLLASTLLTWAGAIAAIGGHPVAGTGLIAFGYSNIKAMFEESGKGDVALGDALEVARENRQQEIKLEEQGNILKYLGTLYASGESGHGISEATYDELYPIIKQGETHELYEQTVRQIMDLYNTSELYPDLGDLEQSISDLEEVYGTDIIPEAEGFTEWEPFAEELKKSTDSEIEQIGFLSEVVESLKTTIADMQAAIDGLNVAANTLARRQLQVFLDGRTMAQGIAPYSSEIMAVAYSDE